MKPITKHLLAGMTSGLFMGALCGALEFLFLTLSFHVSYSRIAPFMLFYGATFSLIAGASAIVLGLLDRKSRRIFSSLLIEYAGLVVVIHFYLLVFKRANFKQAGTHWFMSALSTPSIIGNLAFLVAAGLLLYIVHRLSRKLPKRPAQAIFFTGAGIALIFFCSGLWPRSERARLFSPPSGAREELPNVIIILVDTLRADHMSLYGYDRETTPTIDQFAEEGVRFERCIAAAAWTKPSTASVLTGLYPPSHQHNFENSVLPDAVPIFPDIMSGFGYRTAFLSANSTINMESGFGLKSELFIGNQRHLIKQSSLLYAVAQLNNLARLILKKDFLIARKVQRLYGRLKRPEVKLYHAGTLNRHFLEWIDRDRNSPFCAYLHYMEPHTPYSPRRPYDQIFVDPDYRGPDLTDRPFSGTEFPLPPLRKGPALPEDQRQHLIAKYDGEILSFDAYFSELIAELKKRNLYDNTLIVFTSDHGEEFYEHSAWFHQHSMYEELIHVPLIVKLPAGRHAGLVIKGTCRHVDILPTVLELISVKPWPELQGISLAAVIENEESDWPGLRAYSDTYAPQGIYLQTYMENKNKLIHINDGQDHYFLYDLERDPQELNSLHLERQTTVLDLDRKMRDQVVQFEKYQPKAETRELGEEEKQRMRDMGYLQ